MTRKEAKDLFRNDKDAYGKPRHIMKNIDKIYDDFEVQQQIRNLNISNISNSVFDCPYCGKEWDTDKRNSCECGAYIGKH